MSIAAYWTRARLRRRTLLIAVSGVCSILIMIGISDHSSLNESVDQRLQERLVLAKVVAGNLEYLIVQNLSNLQSFSFLKGVNLQDSDLGPEKAALHEVALRSLCTNVFLLDRNGRILCMEPHNELRAREVSKHVPVPDAIAATKPYVSNLFVTSQRNMVLLLVPLSQNGSLLGFIGGELDPMRPEFFHILQKATIGTTGFAEVVDGQGMILASNRSEGEPQQENKKSFLLKLMKARQPVVTQEFADQVLAFYPITGISWSVYIGQSKTEALGPLHKMERRLFAFGILLLLATIILTWGISESVIRPVQSLTESATRISSGDLEHAIAFSGSDEIGVLGKTLDEMRVKLRDSLETVQHMNADLENRVEERTKQVSDLYEELKRKEEVRSMLLLKILSAQEDERKRIARELHDQLSQKLTALLFGLDSGGRDDASNEKIRNLAVSSIDSVHQLIFDLRPAVLDDLGLSAAIEWYAEERLKPLGIKLRFENELDSHRLNNQLETVLFRIAQETISNIARHAKAENVLIAVEMDDDFIKLEVEDDGVGFLPDEFKEPKYGMRGLGLWGMKERASLLNGNLEVESEPGRGTRVLARFPYREIRNNG
jgi:signal transduction histidine kinase